ncbi:MAG: hypothetical protein LN588_04960, partial [Rickettsia endosymbiont of Bryobia graminum]|nr:hypothetical protein [Rickettsia endosymbiont of Bryobia graminum]
CVRLVLSYDVPSTSLFVLLSIHSYSQCPKLYNSSPIFATLHLQTVYKTPNELWEENAQLA